MNNLNQPESIGPFKAMGVALNTVGSAAIVLDHTVKSGGSVVINTLDSVNMVMEKGNEALELALAGPIEDMKTDEIVASAERKVRVAQATAEAAKILAQLDPPKDS